MVVTVDYFYPRMEPDVNNEENNKAIKRSTHEEGDPESNIPCNVTRWKTLYLPLFFLEGIVCMVERKILGKEKKITTWEREHDIQ